MPAIVIYLHTLSGPPPLITYAESTIYFYFLLRVDLDFPYYNALRKIEDDRIKHNTILTDNIAAFFFFARHAAEQ